jgi:protein-tyrosine-phosphatase
MSLQQPVHVLFLCNHNTARSLLAEAVLNHIGGERFRAHSAGCQPSPDGQAHPLTLEVLQSAGIRTDGLRSKSWDELALPQAPHMDLVITLCDEAAAEVCPVWPGHPATAHWGYEDPTRRIDTHDEQLFAFKHVLHALHQRLELLLNLPLAQLDRLMLETEARRLAQS